MTDIAADGTGSPPLPVCAPSLIIQSARKQPWFAVDCIVFDERERVLLIRRKNPPSQGQYALPGDFIDYGETVEHAAARELREETNLGNCPGCFEGSGEA